MEGSFLRFYVDEKQRHHGVLLWEWLLESANKMGVRGGSAFRSIGGFGRHHALHEDHFFELAGSTGVEVEFVVDDDESKQLLALIKHEKIRIFYARFPARFGVVNPDAEDASGIAAEELQADKLA
jgi:PII-like signaling protein